MRSSGSGAVSTTFSSSSFTSTGTKSDEVVTYNISNLTLSLHNTLIYYVHLDQGDGVILTPHLKDSTKSGQLRKILIENFKNSVQIIHATLQCCTSHRENMRKSSSASVGQENDSPWINKALVPVKEQVIFWRFLVKKVGFLRRDFVSFFRECCSDGHLLKHYQCFRIGFVVVWFWHLNLKNAMWRIMNQRHNNLWNWLSDSLLDSICDEYYNVSMFWFAPFFKSKSSKITLSSSKNLWSSVKLQSLPSLGQCYYWYISIIECCN